MARNALLRVGAVGSSLLIGGGVIWFRVHGVSAQQAAAPASQPAVLLPGSKSKTLVEVPQPAPPDAPATAPTMIILGSKSFAGGSVVPPAPATTPQTVPTEIMGSSKLDVLIRPPATPPAPPVGAGPAINLNGATLILSGTAGSWTPVTPEMLMGGSKSLMIIPAESVQKGSGATTSQTAPYSPTMIMSGSKSEVLYRPPASQATTQPAIPSKTPPASQSTNSKGGTGKP